VFADGSVHFLKAGMDIRILARLVTRAGTRPAHRYLPVVVQARSFPGTASARYSLNLLGEIQELLPLLDVLL
jgi:hypothetical protein